MLRAPLAYLNYVGTSEGFFYRPSSLLISFERYRPVGALRASPGIICPCGNSRPCLVVAPLAITYPGIKTPLACYRVGIAPPCHPYVRAANTRLRAQIQLG